MGADDLDTGLEYEPVFSDSELGGEEADVIEDSFLLPESPPTETSTAPKTSKSKRKRNDKIIEKKKRKTVDIIRQKQSISTADSSLIADHVSKLIRKHNPDLSSLELAEKILPESCIKSTSNFELPRTDSNYCAFLTSSFKRQIKAKKEERGQKSGLVVVVAISAIRACDINRVLCKEIKSIKLIKKNSVTYDKKALSLMASPFAVTTCGRLAKLISLDIIDPTNIQAIVIDSTHLNEKLQTVWDLPDTPEILSLVLQKSPSVKVLLY